MTLKFHKKFHKIGENRQSAKSMEIKFVIIVNDLTAPFFVEINRYNIVFCPLSQVRDDFHFHQVKTAISTRISSFYNFTRSISNTQTIQWTMSSPNPSRNQSGVQRSRHLPSNLTIVTAYWNLGTFQKGPRNLHFSTKTYFKWATVFKYLVNPLVVYTDSEAFKELMERLRTDHINNTLIYLTNRTDLWPFKFLYEVRSVYDVPGYPKSHPNTVVSDSTFQIRGGGRHCAKASFPKCLLRLARYWIFSRRS